MESVRAITPTYLAILATVFVSGVCGASLASDCDTARSHFQQGLGYKPAESEQRRAAFQKAVEMCPSFLDAWVNLGDALRQLAIRTTEFSHEGLKKKNSFLAEAEQAFLKALALDPNMVQARLHLAEKYVADGQLRKARAEYEKVLEVDPGDKTAPPCLEFVNKMISREDHRYDSGPTSLQTAEQIRSEVKNAPVGCGSQVMSFGDHTAEIVTQIFDNILFEHARHEIEMKEAKSQLREIGKALKSGDLEGYRIIIEGHCNQIGSREINDWLSKKRAEKITDYLARELGISDKRMVWDGFGFDRLKYPEQPTHPGNRRVEVKFIPPAPQTLGR